MKRVLLFFVLLLLCGKSVNAQEIIINQVNVVGTGEIVELSAEEYIKQCMLEKQAVIDVSEYALSIADVRTIYGNIINFTPELFYINNSYSITTNTSTGYVSTIKKFYYYANSDYSADVETIAAKKAEIDAIVNLIATQVSSYSSDYEKLLFVHDYLVEHTSYDYSSTTQSTSTSGYPKTDFDMYGALVLKQAVCQGYSHAFKYICDQLNLGTNGFAYTSSHVWNQIELDGLYYNVDCTYDEYMYDIYMKVQHANFLKSDTEFNSSHGSYTADYSCTSTIYDDTNLDNVITHLCKFGNKYYYVKNSKLFYGTIVNNNWSATDVGIILPDAWTYTNVCMYDDKNIIYNTKTGIRLYNLETEKSVTIIEPYHRNIFGIHFDGTKVTYGHRYYTITGNTTVETIDSVVLDKSLVSQIEKTDTTDVSTESVNSSNNPIKFVKISSSSAKIPKTGKLYLKAKYYPADADNFKSMIWKSSNKKVATVNSSGAVTGKKVGTATITCTVNNEYTVSCKVTVYNYGLTKVKEKYYYYDIKGKKIKNKWKTVKGKKYYFNKKGQAVTGWKTIKGKKYYFSKKGVMQTGWKKIGKYKYYFNKKGIYKKKVKL